MANPVEVVVKNYSGLSTQTKPTNAAGGRVPNGSRWRDVDTGDIYHFNESTDEWYLTGSKPTALEYGEAVQDINVIDLLTNILDELKILNAVSYTHLTLPTKLEV